MKKTTTYDQGRISARYLICLCVVLFSVCANARLAASDKYTRGTRLALDYKRLPIRPVPPTQELLDMLLQKALTGDPRSRVEYTHWVDLWRMPLPMRRVLGQERITYLQQNVLDERLAKEALYQLGCLRGVPQVRSFLPAYAVSKRPAQVLQREALYAIGNQLGENQFYSTRLLPTTQEKTVLTQYLRSPKVEDQLVAVSAIKRGFILEMRTALRIQWRRSASKDVRVAIRETLAWLNTK